MPEARFAEIVSRIFEKNGFTRVEQTRKQGSVQRGEPDLMMKKGSVTYCLEVRMSRRLEYPVDSMIPAARNLVELAKDNGWVPVVVIGGMIDPRRVGDLLGVSIRLAVIDIENLLYMAKKDQDLYSALIAQQPYAVKGLMPKHPVFEQTPALGLKKFPGDDEMNKSGSMYIVPDPDKSPEAYPRYVFSGDPGSGKSSFLLRHMLEQQRESTADLREEIGQWNGGKHESSSTQYEKLCTRVLMRLFAEDLTLWKEQAKSDAGLFRFDLICKIKRDNHKDFWEVAERYFNSKYIIFEFKNYAQKVTQKEIFTTVRYLYTKALRGIAIIVSPEGIDSNADKAIRGVLRDEGKLVLTLTNAELIRMLEMKEYGEDPADYLSDKLDDLLIDLEK